MKTNSLISSIRLFAVAVLVVGLLAALPVNAFPGSSHGQNYYNYLAQKEQAQSKKASSQTKPEFQVAVMVMSPAQPTATTPKGDIWFGSSQRSHATHGR